VAERLLADGKVTLPSLTPGLKTRPTPSESSI
jgi:hypothetical protein